MPSKKHNAASLPKVARVHRHVAFFPLLIVVWFLWFAYRMLFLFPVWFDELIGKAIFFGLPVSLYISLGNQDKIRSTYAAGRMYPGLLLGTAIGGVYGFVASLTLLLSSGGGLQSAPLFLSSHFWWEFFLAMVTGFWESLFFYGWTMTVLEDRGWGKSLIRQIWMTGLIFILFHLPNVFLRSTSSEVIGKQLLLLALFAIGQALLFLRTRNVYALTLSHAIWGMVLLVSTQS